MLCERGLRHIVFKRGETPLITPPRFALRASPETIDKHGVRELSTGKTKKKRQVLFFQQQYRGEVKSSPLTPYFKEKI